MKKSTLLSFATAAAIVATSAGTYAAWDTTTASNSGTVTIRNKVTTTVEALNFTSDNEDTLLNGADDVPVYTSTTNVDVANVPEAVKGDYKLTTSAKVYSDVNLTSEATGFTVEAKEKEPVPAELNGKHNIDVTVQPTDNTVTPGAYYVKVTAELEKVNSAS